MLILLSRHGARIILSASVSFAYLILFIPLWVYIFQEEMFIGLLLRAMKNDLNLKRVCAFAKRLLQVSRNFHLIPSVRFIVHLNAYYRFYKICCKSQLYLPFGVCFLLSRLWMYWLMYINVNWGPLDPHVHLFIVLWHFKFIFTAYPIWTTYPWAEHKFLVLLCA